MKNTLKLACLLGSSLLVCAFGTSFLNVVNGAGVVMNLGEPSHKIRLYDLYLGEFWNKLEEKISRISAGTQVLNVLNGLVVYGDAVNGDNSSFIVIGGGNGNEISNAKWAGIVGGKINKVGADGSVIGGGKNNIINGTNSIIAGGEWNTAGNGGVVMGGGNNDASHEGTVVLGGEYNESKGKYSLLLGVNSNGAESSFVWNDSDVVNVGEDSAYIGASDGILIGTYESKPDVNLVINGAVKLYERPNMALGTGEIEVYDGCFYAYDGKYGHILGNNKDACIKDENIASVCEFGGAFVQEGDTVVGYSKSYVVNNSTTENCEKYAVTLTCHSGKISDDVVYPYCYDLI